MFCIIISCYNIRALCAACLVTLLNAPEEDRFCCPLNPRLYAWRGTDKCIILTHVCGTMILCSLMTLTNRIQLYLYGTYKLIWWKGWRKSRLQTYWGWNTKHTNSIVTKVSSQAELLKFRVVITLPLSKPLTGNAIVLLLPLCVWMWRVCECECEFIVCMSQQVTVYMQTTVNITRGVVRILEKVGQSREELRAKHAKTFGLEAMPTS